MGVANMAAFKSLLHVLLLILGVVVTSGHGNLLVSGYNCEIATFIVSPNYTLVKDVTWPVDLNMSWLQFEPHSCTYCVDMVYAIHEVDHFNGTKGGAVSRWTIQTSGLVREEWVRVGKGPAHLLVDYEQGMAYTANYGDGSWNAISLDAQRRLNKTQYFYKFGEGCRDSSHPHETVTLGKFVWVVDLGCDTIYHFVKTGSTLTRLNDTSVGRGRGPRHLAIHKQRSLAFLACEVEDYVQVYRLNNKTGELMMIQEVGLSSVKNNTGAEILIHENGRCVYVSSRGVGMVIVFRIEDNDTLTKVQEFRIAGTWPRHMALHKYGKLLVVADQMGDKLEAVHVSEEDGTLTRGQVISSPHQPSFVGFI